MKIGNTNDDFSLLAQFVESEDQASFQQLVERHGSLVMGVCHRILSNSHDAQDAAQATFVQLALKASKLRADKPLAAWLYTVARGKALDLYKSRKRHAARVQAQGEHAMQTSSSATPEPSPSERLELKNLIDEAIHSLPADYRTVVILHHLQGKTLAEIAETLECNSSTISMRLTRAKEKLRLRLSKRGITAASITGATISNIQAATPPLQTGFAEATYTASVATLNNPLPVTATLANFASSHKILATFATILISAGAITALYHHQATETPPIKEVTPQHIAMHPQPQQAAPSSAEAYDPFEMVNTTSNVEDPRHARLYSYIQENLGELDELRNHNGETLLQAAARMGNCTGTFLLLYHGANPNVTDNQQETPLTRALRAHPHGRGSELLRDMLIYKGADVNAHNAEGDTPLIIAIEHNNYNNAEFLLWRGANLYPPSASTHRYPSALANTKGFTKIARMIEAIEYPESAEYPEQTIPKVPEHVSRALIEAAARADLNRLETLLATGAPIDTKNKRGHTPLYTAASKLHVETATYLIFMGADVNALTNHEMTPFMGMMGWMLFEADWIRYMLLLAGADTRIAARNGHTPLTFAADQANGMPLQLVLWSGVDPNEASKHGTAMHIASKKGYQRLVTQLQSNGVTEAPFESNDPGWQIHTATRAGDLASLQQLIAAGTDPDLPDEQGHNPMINAIHSRRIDAARLFMQAESDLNYQIPKSKATPLIATTAWNYWEVNHFRQELLMAGADPNITDKNGTSPLIRASQNGVYFSAISQLLYYGADINHRDKHGKSALDYALESGKTSAADYLIEMGAERK